MKRVHLLAADIFGYSYANYEDHLGIGNARFDRLMPADARTLERADREGWSVEEVARAMDVEETSAAGLLDAFCKAREVVDAPGAAESFRRAVRQVIASAVAKGLSDGVAIEKLVVQICYRAADLAFLLDREGRVLSDYSLELRREVHPNEPVFDDEE